MCPIATGVIDLVRDRMKLTGARWRQVAAEAVLKHRSLRASRNLDAYWRFHEARERGHTSDMLIRIVLPVSKPPPPPSPPRPRPLRQVK